MKKKNRMFFPGVTGFDIRVRVVVLLLMLTASWPATAQRHTVFHFSVPEGLPSSEVYEVVQDRKGFLWFATDNGVARYDGKEFQAFHVKDGLTDPVVFGFFEDEQARLWFRTFSGRLSYFDGERIRRYAYNDQLINNGENGLFRFLYDSRSEELWFTLEHILGKIGSSGQNSLHGSYKRCLFLHEVRGRYLLGGDTRYSIKNIVVNNEKFPIQLTDTSDFKFFNAIQYREKIYVSIYKDVFEYDGETVSRVFTSEAPIISLSKDGEENLWIGYLNRGTEIFRGARKGWRPDFLSNKSVTKVFQDPAGGFWFTTLESGVYYAPNFRIENYALPTPSRLKTVLALEDTVLAGDQSGGLYFFDAGTRKVLAKKNFEHAVWSLLRDRDRNIWVSAGIDVIRYDHRFRKKNFYPGRIATWMTEGPDGSVWTIGGIRISHFNPDGTLAQSEAPDVIYRTVLVDDSVIYLAARTGLHLRDKHMNLIQEPAVFADYKITQIQHINDSTLLFATQGNGIVLVNKKTWDFRQLDTSNKFLANNIYCLTRKDSTLWIGTEKGLVVITIRNLLKSDPEFHHLSQRTGLIGDKINFILPVRGDIWAFADNGFSIVPATAAAAPVSKPVFYVKSIIAGEDTLTSVNELAAHPVTLPYDHNHMTFTFGYISFSNQDVFLRYRISRQSKWVLTSQRALQFLSLAPGDYRFELQYSADNIAWSAPFAPLPFAIDSPWWMKWYTLAGALAFILLLGYAWFRYRQSIYTQRNHYLSIINTHQQKLIQSEIETLERERNRIARELHDGVGTNLSAIKLMVSQLLQHYHAPQAADVEEQFQIALRELKDIIYGLTPPSLGRYGLFTALKNYVSKLNKSLRPVISLQVFGAEINNYEFNIMVFRVVQELISNSIKHSSARNITIHINSFDDMLNIVYEDDGVGFSYDTGHEGLGLANIESRIHSMNGSLRFDSGDHGISYTIDIPLHSIRATV